MFKPEPAQGAPKSHACPDSNALYQQSSSPTLPPSRNDVEARIESCGRGEIWPGSILEAAA